MPRTPPLMVWRSVPLDLEVDVWNWIGDAWPTGLTVVSDRGYPTERSQFSWGKLDYPQLDLETAPPEAGAKANSRLADPDVLHVFYGIRGRNWKRIRQLPRGKAFVLIAERPTRHLGSRLPTTKNAATDLAYRVKARQTRGLVAAFLAMGSKGVSEFSRLGFDPCVLFPYMYAPYRPLMGGGGTGVAAKDRVRFLYLGRLDSRYKGLDLLLEAVKPLDPSSFTLDIVGSYGDLSEAAIQVAEKSVAIRCLGPWQPSQVVELMSDYDVCVVPSRYDGWNAVTNHAINAGLAVITTPEAASDDLVRVSGGGQVVPASDGTALTEAMRSYITDPAMLEAHRLRAQGYASRIATPVVAGYVRDVLDFSLGQFESRPRCPWL